MLLREVIRAMVALILVLSSIVLFVGFVFLTRFEERRGMRYFPKTREALDGRVSAIGSKARTMDLGESTASFLRRLGHRLLHDVAHISLLAVRWVERTLTRVVRSLRAKRAEQAPSAFVATMTDFKRDLRSGSGEEGQ